MLQPPLLLLLLLFSTQCVGSWQDKQAFLTPHTLLYFHVEEIGTDEMCERLGILVSLKQQPGSSGIKFAASSHTYFFCDRSDVAMTVASQKI